MRQFDNAGNGLQNSDQTGVNICNAPAGSTIGLTSLGVNDRTAPGSIDMTNLSTSSYRT